MDPQELVPVYYPADGIQAHAIKQALDAAQIACHIEGENQASWVGGGFMANAGRWRMRLLVRAMDAERARRMIEDGIWPSAGSPGGAR
jgi:hypothetical protein